MKHSLWLSLSKDRFTFTFPWDTFPHDVLMKVIFYKSQATPLPPIFFITYHFQEILQCFYLFFFSPMTYFLRVCNRNAQNAGMKCSNYLMPKSSMWASLWTSFISTNKSRGYILRHKLRGWGPSKWTLPISCHHLCFFTVIPFNLTTQHCLQMFRHKQCVTDDQETEFCTLPMPII